MGFLPNFARAYVRHRLRRFKGQSFWTAIQVEEATEIAGTIRKYIPLSNWLESKDQTALIDGINHGDQTLVNRVLLHTSKYTMQSWCIETIRIGIARASINSSPVIRETMDELLGPDVTWD